MVCHVAFIRVHRSIPGVRAATFAQVLPLTGEIPVTSWPVEGHPFDPKAFTMMIERVVHTDYFRVERSGLRR